MFKKIVFLVSSMMISAHAFAASHFDSVSAAALKTDISDTVADATAWAIGVMVVVTVAWYGVTIVKKGLGKAGVRG